MKRLKLTSQSVPASGRRFNLLWTIPGVVVIAGLAALAVSSFTTYADARRRTQLVLAEVAGAASGIRVAEEVAEQEPSSTAGSQLTAQLTGALASLSRLDPRGEAAENVREAATEYLRNAEEDFRLIRTRDAKVAEWQRLRSDPSYLLALEAVAEARTFYSAQSSSALRHAKVGSSVAIAAQALLIGLLILATQSIRRASELRFAEERVRREVFFRSLVQNSSDVIVLVDASSTTRYVSPSLDRVLGYRPEDWLALECFTNIHRDDLERAHLAFARALDSPNAVIVEELRTRHADGSWRWIELSAKNLLADSNVGGIVINFRDISERKLLEEQLRHQALTDPLTKLANRTLFQNLLDRALLAAKRRQTPVAVFFLDLDEFKQINDGLGHEAGDQLLREISGRLRSSLRAEDTAARLGGDEFAVLLEGLDGELLSDLAERILCAVSRPILLGDQEVTVSMSIGIAITGAREYTSGELLRDADVALYAAKGAGKGRFEMFEDGMYKRVRHNLELEMDLRRALEHEEFELHYQPIVALNDHRLIGVEALVRWQDKGQRRLAMPGEFLPLAEQTGLILPLGRWILLHACTQMQEWYQRFPEAGPILLSVNLSEKQFASSALVQEVKHALAASGMPSSQLVLEVPETVLLHDLGVTEARLEGLRRLGVRVAIDNFGGGYFALSYLKSFPIDIVKIHHRFVESANLGPTETELTRSLIDLARRLKLQTLAEGIEAPRQAAALDGMGCELGQGFFLGRPLAGPAFESCLNAAKGGAWHMPNALELVAEHAVGAAR